MDTELLNYCQNMSISYSYKPVLILALLNNGGQVTLDEAADYFRCFYSHRLELGLIAERSNSIYSRMNCTSEEMRQNIRINPVKALLSTSDLFSFDGMTLSIKARISADEKSAIEKACYDRLTKYYSGIKPDNIICFSRPEDDFGFLSNDYPSTFTLHGEEFRTVNKYLEFRKGLLTTNIESSIFWNGQRQLITYQGIMAKFTQNRRIKADLIDTGNCILAACLQYDTVWGTGITMGDSNIENVNNWSGQNLLGFTLMHVRSVLWCG